MSLSRSVRLGLGAELIRRKLEAFGPLGDLDRLALESCSVSMSQVSAGRDLVRQGEQQGGCGFLLEGWACSYKQLAGGGRQIMSLHVPGDMIDPQAMLRGPASHDVASLGEVVVAAIGHATVMEWAQAHPDLARRLWLNAMVHAATAREWVVNVGRRTAAQRIAHLLCELFTRLDAIGLTAGSSCRLPLTQAHLADATGLSTVHVNRTLQQLRRAGLLQFKGGELVALDWAGLQQVAGFDPGYLGCARAA